MSVFKQVNFELFRVAHFIAVFTHSIGIPRCQFVLLRLLQVNIQFRLHQFEFEVDILTFEGLDSTILHCPILPKYSPKIRTWVIQNVVEIFRQCRKMIHILQIKKQTQQRDVLFKRRIPNEVTAGVENRFHYVHSNRSCKEGI